MIVDMEFYEPVPCPKVEVRRNPCPECGKLPDYVFNQRNYNPVLNKDETTKIYGHWNTGLDCLLRWSQAEKEDSE